MTEVTAAIVKVLTSHGGWITALTLRDQLPNGMPRGEAFDFALGQLIATRRLQTRLTEDGTNRIYRLSEEPAEPPPPRIPIQARGPAQAIAGAFHPPAPAIRAPAVHLADDEVTRPPRNHRQLSPAGATRENDAMTMTSKGEDILELLKKRPMKTAEIAKAIELNEAGAGYHLKELAKARKIGKPDGRLGPWALLNGKGAGAHKASSPAAPTPARAKPRPRPEPVAELRWSIRNDGVVTFIANDTQLEVNGETLDRVNAARQAIADAA
jgi:hypothetical protein